MTSHLVCSFLTVTLSWGFHGDSAEEAITKAKEAMGKYQFEDAILLLTEAIRLDSKNTDAYYNRGLAYERSVKYKEAIEDYSTAIRLDPKLPKIFLARGQAYFSQRQLEKAIADFSEVIRLEPENRDALSLRALSYYENKEYGKAIASEQEVIRIKPKDPRSYGSLARYLAECPDPKYRDGKKALEYATKGCEMTSWKYYNYLESLASAYAELGEFDQAIKWQKKAIELNKKFMDRFPRIKAFKEGRLKSFEDHHPIRTTSFLELGPPMEKGPVPK
jgi:tetratricopeptide (TPR) repeat protein